LPGGGSYDATTNYLCAGKSVGDTCGPWSSITLDFGFAGRLTGFTSADIWVVQDYDWTWNDDLAHSSVYFNYDKNLGTSPCATGNPCNPAIGNKYQAEEDYRSGEGNLIYNRSYNSLAYQEIGLGFNWISLFHKRLEISGSQTQVRRADGRGEPFTCPASGTCQGDSDTQLLLTKGTSGYTLILRDNSTERYDLSGKLISETDSNDRVTNYSYDTNGRLSTVTGPFGHTLAFDYDSSNRIATLTSPTSQVITD